MVTRKWAKWIGIVLLVLALPVKATTFPVSDPNIGNGRLKICAQNLRNYFVVNLAAERPDYHDVAGLEAKTQKIVQAFLHIDADIYAVCEMECQDSAVAYLTKAMNEAAGVVKYGYVNDTQNVTGEQIKSAFIYRIDKVAPYQSLLAASSQSYYKYTMRIQTFEELLTGEKFVFSMNHFKAKDNTEDQGNAKRERNAQDLIAKLNVITYDEDILVMGDLNCQIDETPLQYIVNAGYEEVLLDYVPSAYSYYYGSNQLIDHAFANATMATQIVGAGVFHVNTGTQKNGTYWYSDHDPVLLSMNLGAYEDTTASDTVGGCKPLRYVKDFKSGVEDYIVNTTQGVVYWASNAKYGAVINGYQKAAPMESWLISPAMDLEGYDSATLSFRHQIYYNNTNGVFDDYQSLYYTTQYDEANPSNTVWTKLTIPQYGIKQWVDCAVALPQEAMVNGMRFAFKYTATTADQANYWEIDNAILTATCPAEEVTAIENVETSEERKARKVMRDGKIYIQVGNELYTILGLKK